MVRALRHVDIPTVIEIFRAAVRITARLDYTHQQVMAWAPDEIDVAAWAKRYDTRRAWVAEVGAPHTAEVDAGSAEVGADSAEAGSPETGSEIAGFIELEGASHLDM